MIALTNPAVKGLGISGSKGAMTKRSDGRLLPNKNPPKAAVLVNYKPSNYKFKTGYSDSSSSRMFDSEESKSVMN
jgi:hypothetical protein